jgi:hypothetical protein
MIRITPYKLLWPSPMPSPRVYPKCPLRSALSLRNPAQARALGSGDSESGDSMVARVASRVDISRPLISVEDRLCRASCLYAEKSGDSIKVQQLWFHPSRSNTGLAQIDPTAVAKYNRETRHLASRDTKL